MILCCGEALIDMIPDRSISGSACFVPIVGGAVLNTSISLGRLSSNVSLLTGISTDAFGDLITLSLSDSGVSVSHLCRRDLPTTLAFVHLTDGDAMYTFYTENAADTSLALCDLPILGDDITALFFGGISLCTDPSASTYEHLASLSSPTRVMMLDPNIRSSFIKSEDTYRSRLSRMMDMSDIIKVSKEDLDWLSPTISSLEDQVCSLPNSVNKLILVTLGSEGSLIFRGGDCIAECPVKKSDVIDSVGAGDSFNAGFLHHLSKTDNLHKDGLIDLDSSILVDAASFANRVASITVSRRGADSPWLSELTD